MPEYFRSDEDPLLGTDFERQEKSNPKSGGIPKGVTVREQKKENAIEQTKNPNISEIRLTTTKFVHSCPEPYPVEKYVLIYEERYGPNSPPRWEDEPRNSWEAHLKALAISLMDMFSG